jgi:hypothetical protein
MTNDSIQLESGTTINDVYAAFRNATLGDADESAIRSRNELRDVIHAAGLRYEECERLSVSSDWAYRFSDDPAFAVRNEDNA